MEKERGKRGKRKTGKSWMRMVNSTRVSNIQEVKVQRKILDNGGKIVQEEGISVEENIG